MTTQMFHLCARNGDTTKGVGHRWLPACPTLDTCTGIHLFINLGINKTAVTEVGIVS